METAWARSAEGGRAIFYPRTREEGFASLMASSRGMYTKPARLGSTHVAL